jgi:RNA recognition motif-containing protein
MFPVSCFLFFMFVAQLRPIVNILGHSLFENFLQDETKKDGYVPPHLRNREGQKEEEQQQATVRVTNVSTDATRDDMHDLFRPFGPIARVSVPQDRATGEGRGFAFIDFYNHADAAKAIEAINGTKFNSHILNVDWARPSVC